MNSGPQACTASTFQTKPSAALLFIFPVLSVSRLNVPNRIVWKMICSCRCTDQQLRDSLCANRAFVSSSSGRLWPSPALFCLLLCLLGAYFFACLRYECVYGQKFNQGACSPAGLVGLLADTNGKGPCPGGAGAEVKGQMVVVIWRAALVSMSPRVCPHRKRCGEQWVSPSWS